MVPCSDNRAERESVRMIIKAVRAMLKTAELVAVYIGTDGRPHCSKPERVKGIVAGYYSKPPSAYDLLDDLRAAKAELVAVPELVMP